MYQDVIYDPPEPTGPPAWASAVLQAIRRFRSIDASTRRRLGLALTLIGALVGLELFNFSTSEFALTRLLGEIRLLGLSWATLLALSLCAIDFTALVKLFAPSSSRSPWLPQRLSLNIENWYLLAAWFLTATLNAILTWWALTLVMGEHVTTSEIVSRQQVLTLAPIVLAALVWLTRLLIIGMFSLTGEQLFSGVFDSLRPTVTVLRPFEVASGPALTDRHSQTPRTALPGSSSQPARRLLNPHYNIPRSAPVPASAYALPDTIENTTNDASTRPTRKLRRKAMSPAALPEPQPTYSARPQPRPAVAASPRPMATPVQPTLINPQPRPTVTIPNVSRATPQQPARPAPQPQPAYTLRSAQPTPARPQSTLPAAARPEAPQWTHDSGRQPAPTHPQRPPQRAPQAAPTSAHRAPQAAQHQRPQPRPATRPQPRPAPRPQPARPAPVVDDSELQYEDFDGIA